MNGGEGPVECVQQGERQGSREMIVRNGGSSSFEENHRDAKSHDWQDVLKSTSSTGWGLGKRQQGLGFLHALQGPVPEGLQPTARNGIQAATQDQGSQKNDGTRGRDARNTTHENLHSRRVPDKTVGRGPFNLGSRLKEETKLNGRRKPSHESKAAHTFTNQLSPL